MCAVGVVPATVKILFSDRSEDGDISMRPLSPVSTHPSSPSNRTAHVPNPNHPFSRITNLTPLAYCAIMSSPSGVYSTGAVSSA